MAQAWHTIAHCVPVAIYMGEARAHTSPNAPEHDSQRSPRARRGLSAKGVYQILIIGASIDYQTFS